LTHDFDVGQWVDPEPLSDVMRRRPTMIDGRRIGAPEPMRFH
jgi:hypothetical protein